MAAPNNPEPGQLFLFGRPPANGPVVSAEVRNNFQALACTNYTTDTTGPLDPSGNPTPAFPSAPQPGMLRVNAANPNNVKLEMFLIVGGSPVWRSLLQNIQVGFAAPTKLIIQFPAGPPTPPNPWVINHNLGSQVLVQPFDLTWTAFQVVPAGGAVEAVPSTADKGRHPSATTGNGQPTGLAITQQPMGYVSVGVNGYIASVGDGTKTGVDCYFSGDGGTTARAQSAIVAGDQLYWNGITATFNLSTGDRVDFYYATTESEALGTGQCVVQQATVNRVLVTFGSPTPGNLVLVG